MTHKFLTIVATLIILTLDAHGVCNSAPEAAADFVTAASFKPVLITPLANDSDIDGDPLSLTLLDSQCPGGLVTNNGDGTITYRRTSGASGLCTLRYRAEDSSQAESEESNIDITTPIFGDGIFADGFESGNTSAWVEGT